MNHKNTFKRLLYPFLIKSIIIRIFLIIGLSFIHTGNYAQSLSLDYVKYITNPSQPDEDYQQVDDLTFSGYLYSGDKLKISFDVDDESLPPSIENISYYLIGTSNPTSYSTYSAYDISNYFGNYTAIDNTTTNYANITYDNGSHGTADVTIDIPTNITYTNLQYLLIIVGGSYNRSFIQDLNNPVADGIIRVSGDLSTQTASSGEVIYVYNPTLTLLAGGWNNDSGLQIILKENGTTIATKPTSISYVDVFRYRDDGLKPNPIAGVSSFQVTMPEIICTEASQIENFDLTFNGNYVLNPVSENGYQDEPLGSVTVSSQSLAPNLTVTAEISSHVLAQKGDIVTATNTIDPTGQVNYIGVNYISLLPGFYCENGAVFKAYITDCNTAINTTYRMASLNNSTLLFNSKPNNSTKKNINSETTSSVNLYPIPASNELYVSSSNFPVNEISIIDMTGNKVITITTPDNSLLNKYLINTGSLKSGIYFIQLKNNSSMKTEKIIII